MSLLFCPFCQESFEDEERCPDHDLPLVTFDELQRTRGQAATEDDAHVAAYSASFGRGWLAAAGMLWIVGFFLPFVRTQQAAATGLELASSLSMNLWTVPCLAFALFSVLLRRRTPASMRSARLAVLVLILGPAVSVAFTLYRVFRGAGWLRTAASQDIEVVLLAGPYVVAAGVFLGFVGAFRFGRVQARSPSYRVQ